MEVKINELLIYWLLLFKIHLKIKIKYVIVLKLKFGQYYVLIIISLHVE